VLYCTKYLPLGPSVASGGLACYGVFVVLRHGPGDSRYRFLGLASLGVSGRNCLGFYFRSFLWKEMR